MDCPFKRRHACNVAWYEEEPQGPQVRNSRYLRGHVVPEAVQNHMGLPYLCTEYALSSIATELKDMQLVGKARHNYGSAV